MTVSSSTCSNAIRHGDEADGDPELGVAASTKEMVERGVAGRAIRSIRASTGLGQGEFAAMLKRPSSDILDWERGRRAPTEAEIQAVRSACEAWLKRSGSTSSAQN